MSPPDGERAPRHAGVGLGLRWEFLEAVVEAPALPVACFEISPENYMRRGGYYPELLDQVRARYPVITHGLTLSLGAKDEPDPEYLRELRRLIAGLGTPWHSDHLCFSTAGPLVLHDLLPLKFSRENVDRVVSRLGRVRDALGVPMAIENISWYAHPGKPEMTEAEFVGDVVRRSGCGLLLDVNNVFVNAQNHDFDAIDFMSALPLDRVVEIHVAGHTRQGPELILDTHGAPVIEPVLELLDWALRRTGPVAVILERDNAVPSLDELLAEVDALWRVYRRALPDAAPPADRAQG